ncbi:MAG: SH3 domain-containing protein, partial [Pyrinomonadaceae bacterium]
PKPSPPVFEPSGRVGPAGQTPGGSPEHRAGAQTILVPPPVAHRPRIVVPLNAAARPEEQQPAPQHPAATAADVALREPRHTATQKSEARQKPAAAARHQPEPLPAAAGWTLRRWLVALLLVLGFALILLGTDHFVRGRKQATQATKATPSSPPGSASPYQTGREMLTTTSVNVRTGPGRSFDRIGTLGMGSRVRILQANGSWVEVSLLELNGASVDVSESGRGWIDGRVLR